MDKKSISVEIGHGVPRGQHVGSESTVMRANCIPVSISGCKGEARILRKIIIPTPSLSTGKATPGTLGSSGFESTIQKRF